MIYIIGAGPGNLDYLTPIAKRKIEEADCLIGASRLLSLFGYLNKETVCLKNNFAGIISYIKKNKAAKKIAVLVSGDPGLYSLSNLLRKAFKKTELEIIPGISAMQAAFAKIGENWQDTKIISLHGRAYGNIAREIKSQSKVFLFTDAQFAPEKIAEHILSKGVENRRAVVFENLGYPDEKVIETNLKELSKMKGFGLCVLIIEK